MGFFDKLKSKAQSAAVNVMDAADAAADKIGDAAESLEEKFEAMVKRDLYTKYKTAPTEEEREKARQ
ncbi:MAG: hypothetical protein J6C02_06130, partial [Peptococcaceae bacterium]|nr:hypothetical protein [Peptococcaceae bacterium]